MLRTRAASGVGYGAIGGAASAAFSPDLLKAIDPTGADLNPGQQAVMAGFATLLGGGLAGLAGANAQGGAIAGQNEVLNNDTASQDHIADAVKNGGFGSAALTMLYTAMPWLPGNPFAQATGQAVTSVVNGVLSQAQANYGRRTPPSDADPLTQASDGNNTPSGTAGAVVTPGVQFCDPERGCVMNPPALVLAGTPIVSSGGSDDGSSTGGSGQGPTANNAAPTGSQPPTIGAFKGASQGTVDRINGVISSGKDTTEGSGARNVTMPADDSMNSGFAQLTEGGRPLRVSIHHLDQASFQFCLMGQRLSPDRVARRQVCLPSKYSDRTGERYLRSDITGEFMGKLSPVLWDDENVYALDKCETEFLLNARRLFDFGFGMRFDDVVVRKMKYFVGLLLHTTEVVQYDDSVIEKFFDVAEKRGVDFLYAIPTGYCHDKSNEGSMEVYDYEPPLLGKIKAKFEWFSKIRGGQIGIYSRSVYFFSRCLNFSLLDVDGQYSLVMGSRDFVDEVVGAGSWNVLDDRGDILTHVAFKLREARIAYGYE